MSGWEGVASRKIPESEDLPMQKIYLVEKGQSKIRVQPRNNVKRENVILGVFVCI